MSKLFRSSSNYLVHREDYDLLFEDQLVLQFYRDFLPLAASTSTSGTIDKYPGDTKFANDLLHILVNEFHFNIVPDRQGRIYDISPSAEGTSIYFDTIYDITNVDEIHAEGGYLERPFKDAKIGIGCAVEIRISDHILKASRFNDGKQDDYAKKEVAHIKKMKPSVSYVIEEQQGVVVDEYTLRLNYRQALARIKHDLKVLINKWSKIIKKRRDNGEWEGTITSLQ